MYPDTSDVIIRVKPLLAEYLLDQKGERLESLDVVRTSSRSFSVVNFLLAKTSGTLRRFVTKTIIHHPINRSITENENQALVEFGILKQLHPRFKEIEHCAVPKPLAVLPDLESYLMEYVEGHLLNDLFRYTRFFSSRSAFCQLERSVFHAGLWLKHLQDFSGIHPAGSRALDGVTDRAEHRLRLIEKLANGKYPKDFMRRTKSFIQEQLNELSGTEILVTGRHGDFTPWNIIADGKGITVIDFLGYDHDPIPVDILKMLVYLDDEGNSLTANPRRVTALKKAFLSGFGQLPHVPVPLLLICEAMQRIVSLWGNLSSASRKPHHRVEAARRIRGHIDWLTSKGERRLLWLSDQLN